MSTLKMHKITTLPVDCKQFPQMLNRILATAHLFTGKKDKNISTKLVYSEDIFEYVCLPGHKKDEKIYYSIAEKKQIFPKIDLSNNHFLWLDGKTHVVSEDLKTFYSFPDGEKLLKFPVSVAYMNRRDDELGKYMVVVLMDNTTVFIDVNFKELFRREKSVLINTDNPSVYVFEKEGKTEFVETKTWTDVFTTSERVFGWIGEKMPVIYNKNSFIAVGNAKTTDLIEFI